MRRFAALLALVMVVLVAGCNEDEPPATGVNVDGPTFARPDITFKTPLKVSKAENHTYWAGAGERIKDGGQILAHYLALSAADGSIIGDTYDTGPQTFTLGPDLPAWLYDALGNVKPGARILRLEPGLDSIDGSETANQADDPEQIEVPTDGVVVVFDILSTRADGEVLEAPVGVPTVTRGDRGAPTVAIPEGTPEPADLVQKLLISGSGPQVHMGQMVTIQYAAIRWKDGGLSGSTWGEGGVPVTFQVGVKAVFQALDLALVEQTVGSQVLVVAPESQAVLGQGTMIIVVDILAVSGLPIED